MANLTTRNKIFAIVVAEILVPVSATCQTTLEKSVKDGHDMIKKFIAQDPFALIVNLLVLAGILFATTWLIALLWRKLITNRQFCPGEWGASDPLLLIAVYLLCMSCGQVISSYLSLSALVLLVYWVVNIGCVWLLSACYYYRLQNSYFRKSTSDLKTVTGLQSIPLRELGAVLLGYILFIPWYYASYLGAHVVFVLWGKVPQPQQVAQSILRAQGLTWLLAVSTALIIAPLLEEFVFRVFFYTSFRKVVGRKAALFLSSLLFAVMHGNALAFLPIFALGIFLALVYEKTQSVCAPVCVHVFHNSATLFYLYLI